MDWNRELTRTRWEGCTMTERETLARRLAKELPTGFELDGIHTFFANGLAREVALFTKEDTSFALIPGDEARIGYDAERPWTPNPDEAESWQDSVEEYEFPEDIREHIAAVTLRPRPVQVGPCLVETRATEPAWERIGLDDPTVQSLLNAHPDAEQVEQSRGGESTRVRRLDSGQILAERSLSRTPAMLNAQLKAKGFRFPSSDEWEYFCGGGAPTLFRWGDHVPCDRYPSDRSPEEAAWKRDWVLSGGTLPRPAGGFAQGWALHRMPNTLGLTIASDPYKFELVAEPGLFRGGDGGGYTCGGAGFFLGWLTLATAWMEEHTCRTDPNAPVPQGYTVGRRVLDLR
jgi:hypothetical protein